ncbi:MAG: hypothetical protein HY966_07155 [Ignavibacteriales bacterium]|nr:hypothetical protein [Ignavibacteriales bacterium]
MKKTIVVALVLVVATLAANAQFRSKSESRPTVSETLTRGEGDGLLFGWFDPSRLTMRNSYSLSYSTLGSGQGMSLGTLTSSLNYQISNPLSVSFDVSLMHQPFGGLGGKLGPDFSGVYLTRAQLDYRPSKNFLFQVQFRQLPAMYWMSPYGYDRFGGSFGSGFTASEDKP